MGCRMSKSVSKPKADPSCPQIVVGEPMGTETQLKNETLEEMAISLSLWKKFASVYDAPISGFQEKNVVFPELTFYANSTFVCSIVIHATQAVAYAEFQVSTSVDLRTRPKYPPLSQTFTYSATTPSMVSYLIQHIDSEASISTSALKEFVCSVLRCHNGE